MHEERNTRQKTSENNAEHPVPQYMLDRENQTRAKVLSNTIKQKRKEKAVRIVGICTFYMQMVSFTSNFKIVIILYVLAPLF